MVDLGVNKIGARLLSFSVAVVATWVANRLWTFRGHDGPKRSLAREFASYLSVQSVGFAANFAVYWVVIYSAR
ncbi:MAG: GtrA family protein [Caulobacteraceae bacterium]